MPRRPGRSRTPNTRERPPWTRVRAALCQLRTDQRGAGTVELVIATPLLLLLILLIAQFALYMHATHIAQAAAAEALSAARVYGGSASAGNTEGQRVLTQLGSGPLQGTSVNVQRGPTQASVTVTGTVINVIPFATFTVHAEAVGPVEKFTPPTGTGAVSP
jgi:Flp pilus assembly protein TadG